MEGLAVFIGQFINWIILGLAIITGVGFAFVVLNVGKLQSEIDEDQKRKVRKDYTADIAAFDKVQQEILKMDQFFVEGIFKQFPNAF